MFIYRQLTLSEVCDLGKHKGHKKLGVIDDIEIWVCTSLQKITLRGRRDRIRSILRIAEVCREVLPKVESETEAIKGRSYVFRQRVLEGARSLLKIHMRDDTVKWAMHWLVEAARLFKVGVNGLVHKLPSVEPYEAYVRVRDQWGDPPIVDTIFTCPVCNTVWDLVELGPNAVFGCTDCCSWYVYTMGGDVDLSWLTPSAATVKGNVVTIFGAPTPSVSVWLNKKKTTSDEYGNFIFQGIPPGKYTVRVEGDPFIWQGASKEIVLNGGECVNLSLKLTPRVARYAGIFSGVLLGKSLLGRLAGAGFGALVGEAIDDMLTSFFNR